MIRLDEQELKRRFVRKRRLMTLIKEVGYQREVAKVLGVRNSYVSQLLTPAKSFTSATARRIELAFGKPQGWLDFEEFREQSTEWPFAFDSVLWYQLPLTLRMDLEHDFHKAVTAAIRDMTVSDKNG